MSAQGPFMHSRLSPMRMALVVFMPGILGIAPVHAQQQANLPGMTYDSLKSLPDWSGLWGRGDSANATFLEQPPPLKPDLLAQWNWAPSGDSEPDPGRYCRPQQFTGYNGGFIESVEFLFTPGRVTLTNERGLIRRIYTDGAPLPSDPFPSNTGTSVGHWEGQTLIVETIGINPQAKFPSPERQGAVAIGSNAKITERITRTSPDALEIEREVVAPDIFTAPDKRKFVYRPVLKKRAGEITLCADNDRAIDPATGKQRFDMTPPADLPPPPTSQ
jgi:hypothetical protein